MRKPGTYTLFACLLRNQTAGVVRRCRTAVEGVLSVIDRTNGLGHLVRRGTMGIAVAQCSDTDRVEIYHRLLVIQIIKS